MDIFTQYHGPNHLLARLVIEELSRNGIEQFFISPGNQSAPIVLAITERSDLRVVTHFDERGAAFCALGYAKATGKPAALITTSGSALANCYPAVVEAAAANLPLILITADRLEQLQDTGANQTFAQIAFFGKFVRWEHTLSASAGEQDYPAVLTVVDQLVYRSCALFPGPVHLNLRLSRPTIPSVVNSTDSDLASRIKSWQSSVRPYTSYNPSKVSTEAAVVSAIAARIKQAKRGIVVIGSLEPTEDLTEICALLVKLNWPVIAEVTSQLRFYSSKLAKLLVTYSHWYLAKSDICSKLSPDLVLQLGAEPIQLMNSPVEFIEASDSYRILVSNTPNRQDPGRSVSERIVSELGPFARELAREVEPGASELLRLFKSADELASEHVRRKLKSQRLSELAIAASIFEYILPEHQLVLGNSLSVRMVSWVSGFLGQVKEKTKKELIKGRYLAVICNRGLSGIDGTIATSAGATAAGATSATMTGLGRRPTTVLCGDQTLLYDLNSLAILKEENLPVTIVVLNNGGGGIFSGIFKEDLNPDFQAATIAPHEFGFAAAAKMFGIDYHLPLDLKSFESVYKKAIGSSRPQLIEIKVSYIETKQNISELMREVTETVSKLKF